MSWARPGLACATCGQPLAAGYFALCGFGKGWVIACPRCGEASRIPFPWSALVDSAATMAGVLTGFLAAAGVVSFFVVSFAAMFFYSGGLRLLYLRRHPLVPGSPANANGAQGRRSR